MARTKTGRAVGLAKWFSWPNRLAEQYHGRSYGLVLFALNRPAACDSAAVQCSDLSDSAPAVDPSRDELVCTCDVAEAEGGEQRVRLLLEVASKTSRLVTFEPLSTSLQPGVQAYRRSLAGGTNL